MHSGKEQNDIYIRSIFAFLKAPTETKLHAAQVPHYACSCDEKLGWYFVK